MKIINIFFALAFCVITAGCAAQNNKAKIPAAVTETVTETTAETTTETTTVDEVMAKLDSMSLDEKIGQMIIAAYRSENGVNVTEATDRIKDDIEKYNIGGFILFDENMQSVDQTKQLIRFYKENSRITPFIAIDEEGGAVSRIAASGIISDYYIPSAKQMARQGREAVIENYTKIAGTLLELGFNMDFAPVADVDTNPANPVIGDRAFGSDPETARDMMIAAMETLSQNGILPVVKHFPGHGDTQNDSHVGLTVLPHDVQRLEQIELVPFVGAIENGAPAIMAAHLTTPQLSDSGLPASLDPYIITDLLRGRLGYDGLVITDALDMGAIADLYGEKDAAVKAVNAGADILLMPPDVKTAFDAVKNAVENGDIDPERIDRSVYRILKTKMNLED